MVELEINSFVLGSDHAYIIKDMIGYINGRYITIYAFFIVAKSSKLSPKTGVLPRTR